jgi:hypothetical protein
LAEPLFVAEAVPALVDRVLVVFLRVVALVDRVAVGAGVDGAVGSETDSVATDTDAAEAAETVPTGVVPAGASVPVPARRVVGPVSRFGGRSGPVLVRPVAGFGTASTGGFVASRGGALAEPREDEPVALLVTRARPGVAAAAVRRRLRLPLGEVDASTMTVTPDSMRVRSTRLPCEAGMPASSNARWISSFRR